ncbi:MAG: bug family protein [Peptococcaceae bacterium BRH_c8a]|nr:MAG: bug family protein [Peptococcaceae bacterium BRH_c8a]
MNKKLFVIGAVFLLSLTLLVGCGGQDKQAGTIDYPTKPIKYVIPFEPGGQSDLEARRQQRPLEQILGTSIVIENKAGGGGAVGWAELVNKKPDGYYMTGINIPHIILQPLARENAGYQTDQIITVALFQATPIGLAVHPDSPYNTLDEFIEAGKKNPGKITVSGSGTLSGHDIALMQLEDITGAKYQYIPAQGAAPSIQSFLGKHVDAILANSNDLVQHQDKMKILAIGSGETFEPLPEVKTFKELGIDMIASIDRGVAVPPNTDPQIIETLEKAFLEIANDQDIQAQMLKEGFMPLAMGSEESKQYINEMKKEYSVILEKVKK